MPSQTTALVHLRIREGEGWTLQELLTEALMGHVSARADSDASLWFQSLAYVIKCKRISVQPEYNRASSC